VDPEAGTSEQRVLVVDPGGQTEGGVPSLSAAFAGAASGDVIELHYTGRLERAENALFAVNLEVTVRPGPGFEPVVVYRPKADPIKYPHSMFLLIGSRLTFENIALELDVPPDVPADAWSMFQLAGREGVALQGCSVTLRNPSFHPDVAVFRLRAPPGSGMGLGDAAPSAERRVRLSLSDCVVRGQSVLLRMEDPLATDLVWENGLLVTNQLMLRADGGDKAPQPDEEVRVELKHVTAVVRGGLCRWIDSSFAPHQLPARITSARCVFLGSGPAPLVLQETVVPPDAAPSRITWRGQRNCYSMFDHFWMVSPVDAPGEPKTWSLDDWLSGYGPEAEIEPSTGPLSWLTLPVSDRPVHEHTPADYVIFESASWTEAEDGGGVGFQQESLPDLP
jgi:hypothetical protein